MKTTIVPLLLSTCLTLLAIPSCLGQETHTVILTVDTANLNRGNPSNACTFNASSNTEIVDDSSPENFTILVHEDDTIIWEAISESGEEIDIESIEIEDIPGKKKLFNASKLMGANGNSTGKKKVNAKVDKRTKGQEYKYAIEFTVENEIFSIDPKIKVGQ